MYYCIDNDTKEVESKSDNIKELLDYVNDNRLTLAVSVVGSFEEVFFKFTMEEMTHIYGLLNGNPPKFENDDHAANMVWNTLEEHQDEFPKFTKALGKRLIKAADKRAGIISGIKMEIKQKMSTQTTKPTTTTPPTQDKPSGVRSVRSKDLVGMVFAMGDKPTKAGTAFHLFTECIEDNIDQATFDELVEYFIANYQPKDPTKVIDDKFARGYVLGAYKAGHIAEDL